VSRFLCKSRITVSGRIRVKVSARVRIRICARSRGSIRVIIQVGLGLGLV
jgi:hypothetical protein